ncbi:putative protein kinase [Trypanosoma rangeli]|uniref:Uncharacterized protein n=1 Tax=Trypanosoma rangeli TaxID=5698 RepID=A0A3R7KXE2_TRYRA|nr:putative protein kinase [Trypanosoma rangeli]RNF03246.1 putative protein kinase [Trypanosoma rangeli]|eukprot:RNF03246.1 putative protein kinase [Trypanosoma rangeli]
MRVERFFFFEITGFFLLFPGNSELHQIHKIHNMIDTPPFEVLNKLKRFGTHIGFEFSQKRGSGIAELLPNASPEVLDLLTNRLTYDEEHRETAHEPLRHPYCKTLREKAQKARRL